MTPDPRRYEARPPRLPLGLPLSSLIANYQMISISDQLCAATAFPWARTLRPSQSAHALRRRPLEKETEGVGGEGRRGFRAIELPGRNFVAGGRVEDRLNLRPPARRVGTFRSFPLPVQFGAHGGQVVEGIANLSARFGQFRLIAARRDLGTAGEG